MSNPPTLSREPSFNEPPGILRDPVVLRARSWNTDIPNILPHERVFPIQIGSELFRLSGASLSSDGMYSMFFPSHYLMPPHLIFLIQLKLI